MNKKQLLNSFWMISEKIVSLIGILFVTSFVAKYIGSIAFGKIALATACFQIIQTAAQLGSDNIIFKRVTQNPDSALKLMKSTTLPRVLIYICLSSPLIIWFWTMNDNLILCFAIALSLTCLISSADVYAIYNNASLRSKKNTIYNVCGISAGLLLRYGIAWYQIDPAYLSFPIVFTTLIPYLLRQYDFRDKNVNKLNSRARWKYCRYLFSSGISLVTASLSVAIYTRLSQVILAWLAGPAALGIFSVASSLASSWIFVTAALIASSYTSIFNCNDSEKAMLRAAKLNQIVILVSLVFVVIIILTGRPLLSYLYGSEYSPAYPAMVILSISSLLSALGPIAYRFIIKLSGYSYLSKKMLIQSLISLPLSIVLISKFGLEGAAWSMLITELLSLTLLNYFFSSAIILKMHYAIFFKKEN
ncbi:oligosaccharide flippase family protein [Erwinia oleae]|uniref:oligosaccharide flippase family protein n=1 Tax=Erwinia oleae TaxID=796334 RepID=UPI000558B30D|nr:oligosaccharide flippase family protein [Erwinia oleae]